MGASLVHLTTANVNLTRGKGFCMDRAVDLSSTNPNIPLYFCYNLNNILQLSTLIGPTWSDSDLIVQMVWIPRLHYPVGYVIAPASHVNSRVTISCDKCDLENCDITGFTVTSPNGESTTHRLIDFFDNEDSKLNEDELVIKDEINEITRIPTIPNDFDMQTIPKRLSMQEINERYKMIFQR